MPWKAVWGFVLFAMIATGQANRFENQAIVDIQFSPAETLYAADLRKALPFQKGDRLNPDDVAVAIDNLFATGRFEDIVVEAEPAAGRVVIRFVTQLAWFVGSVTVGGKVDSPPNRGQIASAAQLTLGAPFRDEDLNRAKAAIADLLKENGLYEATVTSEISRDSGAQQIFITFRVEEHKRARYTTPTIQGNTILPTSTIIKATGWRIPIVHWWRQVTASRTRSGVQGVRAEYQKRDRLKAKVELDKLDYDAESRRVHTTLNITPGPRVKVETREAKVSSRVLKKYVPVQQEHAVDNDLLVEGRRNLIDYFQNQGYYDVDIDFQVQPEQDDLQTIEYVISRGQRYRLSKVSITGNQYFSADVVRERMYIQPASFTLRHGRYSEAFQRKDEENIRNLYRSNGFRDVKVTSTVDRKSDSKTGSIAVTVAIQEGPQWTVESLSVREFSRNVRPWFPRCRPPPASPSRMSIWPAIGITY